MLSHLPCHPLATQLLVPRNLQLASWGKTGSQIHRVEPQTITPSAENQCEAVVSTGNTNRKHLQIMTSITVASLLVGPVAPPPLLLLQFRTRLRIPNIPPLGRFLRCVTPSRRHPPMIWEPRHLEVGGPVESTPVTARTPRRPQLRKTMKACRRFRRTYTHDWIWCHSPQFEQLLRRPWQELRWPPPVLSWQGFPERESACDDHSSGGDGVLLLLQESTALTGTCFRQGVERRENKGELSRPP